jgi:hypothetical protein
LDEKERVAHHEAAHVVIAVLYGIAPTMHGIDLNVPTSAPGAFGNAGVATFDYDASLPGQQQRLDLVRNLAIICAGAASDARILSRPLDEALRAQVSDHQAARGYLALSPLISSEAEADYILEIGLARAAKLLDDNENWLLVETIAKAALGNDGALSRDEIIGRLPERLRDNLLSPN